MGNNYETDSFTPRNEFQNLFRAFRSWPSMTQQQVHIAGNDSPTGLIASVFIDMFSRS